MRTRWTKEHSRWLHRQRFAEPALQFTYEADVEQAELLAGHLARIDKQVAATADRAPRGIRLHIGNRPGRHLVPPRRGRASELGIALPAGEKQGPFRAGTAPAPSFPGRSAID
jgi:hypothetical protein